MAEDIARMTYRTAWRRDAPHEHRDALDFWEAQATLPGTVDLSERTRELITNAYLGDRLVGVTTGVVARLPQFAREFVFIRCTVDAAARRSGIAHHLTEYACRVLAQWARSDPANRIAGVAAIVESPELAEFSRNPVWPLIEPDAGDLRGGPALVGFTREGQQVRVCWFSHTVVD
jgi:hypothetical protein